MRSKGLNLIAILLINFFAAESTVYLIDSRLTKMVELSDGRLPCKVHRDRRVIRNILSKSDSRQIRTVDPQMMREISISCEGGNQLNRTGGFIFPGTKWCGPGTIATSFNDLGYYSREDGCCRNHDRCPSQLEPGQCRHGICNTSPFTRSHCDCDDIFRKCLRDIRTDVADILGTLYFNLAEGACFEERRFCPKSMRDNLSYSWFCEEWKFVPFEHFTSYRSENVNRLPGSNEIPEKSKFDSSEKTSKINVDLEKIFGKDEDVKKIMNKSKY